MTTFTNRIPNLNKQQNIISWNIQGLRTGRPDLKLLVHEHQPLVICLQETMCTSTNQTNIAGFTTIHRQRTGARRASGGIITAVKQGLDYQHLNINTDLEAIAIQVGPPSISAF